MAKRAVHAEEYRKRDILTAGKLKSLLLLLNRALLLLKEAGRDPARRNVNIVKTQNILAQLERALDFRQGELAGQLFYLFDYIFAELSNRDDRAVATAINMLTTLKDTFTALSRKR